MGMIQSILDASHSFRQCFVSRLTWLSMRAYGLEIAPSVTIKGRYSKPSHAELDLSQSGDGEVLLELAKEGFSGEQNRLDAVASKCKTLMTMSSLLLAFVGLFIVDSISTENALIRVMVFVAVFLLLLTVTLLLAFFDVGSGSRPVVSKDMVGMDPKTLQAKLTNVYLRCTASATRRTNYLVDVYKTARFYFFGSLGTVAVVFVATFSLRPTPADPNEFIRDLRSDRDLIELLRGPKGERGDQGTDGPRGDRGLKGEHAKVDEQRIIEQIRQSMNKKRK